MSGYPNLNPLFNEYQKRHQLQITEQARNLIVALIRTPEDDPHERWQPNTDRLPEYYHRWEVFLPKVLDQIAKEHQLTKKITTLDVVFWTARNFYDIEFAQLCGPFRVPEDIPMIVPPGALPSGRSPFDRSAR